jgi:hypothetical protein
MRRNIISSQQPTSGITRKINVATRVGTVSETAQKPTVVENTSITRSVERIIPDLRILNLSYSSLLTLHSCPRKYELYKLNATTDATESIDESITFSYGHCVGLGIQLVLEGATDAEIMWKLFLEWKPALWEENTKQGKSFSAAVYAVQKFQALLRNGYLQGYELVWYEGKAACELSFLISLPGGYKYRGSVDAVLRHNETGEVVVLECKTSSATTLHAATYRNSAQAIGYSIVLDAIFPTLSSYKVVYLVYSTKTLSYEQLPFQKSYVQRARWIQELLLDADLIETYVQRGLFPMHGESCFDWYRECKYLGLCEMSNQFITKPLTPEIVEQVEKENAKYQIQITLTDLITHQLAKVGA